MSKRYFEFVEGTSSKFWEIWTSGNEVFTRYGKIGTPGQTTVKDQGSPAGAQKLYDKLVREKTGKGYQEKTAGGSAAPAKPAAKPAATKAKAAPPPDDDDDDDGDDDDDAGGGGAARRFEFVEGTSSKFWEIAVEGSSHTVRFGKIGTEGQAKTKDFGSASAARADADSLIAEKTKKGYVEVGGGSPAPKAAAKPAAAKPAAKKAAPPPDDDEDDEDDDDGDDDGGSGDARRFEFTEDGSSKFWQIQVDGSSHTVTFGKIGTAGQSKTKDFGSASAAQADANKLIAEKTKKGYQEV